MAVEADHLITYRPCSASPEEFVEFWASQYQYGQEGLYTDNIGRRPLTPPRIQDLYIWKNGGKLSGSKEQSVRRNFVARIDECQRLPTDTTAREFLDRYPTGGAIWRIFWLHCWRPAQFPIYDQHVHRAMSFIEGHAEELAGMKDVEKIEAYLRRYLPFWRRLFRGLDGRQVDRALWVFGKFIKTSTFPDLSHSPNARPPDQ